MSLELRVSNISKSYDREPVLQECSFSFDKSGIYVLTGPNGSGKSTFLRICAILEEPDKGEVNFYSDGVPVIKNIELKRRITLLLPKIGVFNTTVFKNVAYGLKIRGLEGSEIQERVDKALDFVGLINKKNQKALTLSSGETQRLGIARALVIEPEIIFLDEPTASVDQKNTSIIENIILKMKNDGKSTVVITTHDMNQAERLADKLLILQNGKLVKQNSIGTAPIFPQYLKKADDIHETAGEKCYSCQERKKIVQHIYQGYRNKEIAQKLNRVCP